MTGNLHGERPSSAAHQSTADPEARLARKGAGKEAKPCVFGQRADGEPQRIAAGFKIVTATGITERHGTIEMIDPNLPGTKRITLGADKGYDTSEFVVTCRAANVTPQVAANDRSPAVGRWTGAHLAPPRLRHQPGKRKRVEEIFEWIKSAANFRRTGYRGGDVTELAAYLVGAAYNLMRIARLTAVAAQPANVPSQPRTDAGCRTGA